MCFLKITDSTDKKIIPLNKPLNIIYMYRYLATKTRIEKQSDIDEKFGLYIGNAFVKAMEECFYHNPIHEEEDLHFGAPMDNVMAMNQLLAVINDTYFYASSELPKSALSSFFKREEKQTRYPLNDVREDTYEGQPCTRYRNMDTEYVQAIIWGAYYYASIRAELAEEDVPIRDFLYQYLLEESCLTEEAFQEHHVLMQFYKRHFPKTMHDVIVEYDKTQAKRAKHPKHDLDYYMNHPVYGLGYEHVISYMSYLSMRESVIYTDDDYLKVFEETESYVNQVLNAKHPELEIPRVHAAIRQKHEVTKVQKGDTQTVSNCNSYSIGCYIEMLFMVALSEQMPEKSAKVKKALTEMHTFLEDFNDKYFYYKGDNMWTLIAERIPARPGLERIEDVMHENEKLREQLEVFHSGKCSSEWYDIVERTVAPFDDVMKPAGFYDLPIIKEMTRFSQCELVLKLFFSPMPMKVALLKEIGFIDAIRQNPNYRTQSAQRNLIEKALNVKSGNRELQGNINILQPGSKEDGAKYTVLSNIEEAKTFIVALKSRRD